MNPPLYCFLGDYIFQYLYQFYSDNKFFFWYNISKSELYIFSSISSGSFKFKSRRKKILKSIDPFSTDRVYHYNKGKPPTGIRSSKPTTKFVEFSRGGSGWKASCNIEFISLYSIWLMCIKLFNIRFVMVVLLTRSTYVEE